MKDLMYFELRECNRIIRQAVGDEKSEGDLSLIKTINTLVRLGEIARKEGLLVLEETLQDVKDIGDNGMMHTLGLLLVDGTGPESVEEIGMRRYFRDDPQGYMGLRYLMTIYGLLALQAGEHPRMLEESLLSMLPEGIIKDYADKDDPLTDSPSYINREKEEERRNKDKTFPEEYYLTKGVAAEPDTGRYYLFSALDYAICHLDNRNLQRVLREMDMRELAAVLTALTGEAVRKVFSNMSSRAVDMIAEEMDMRNHFVYANTAENLCYKTYNIIRKLEDTGEIVMEGSDVVNLLIRQSEAENNELENCEFSEGEKEVMKLLEEYRQHRYQTIKVPRKENDNSEEN
ncbi:MAG: hypothetical protein J6Y89_03220 [Lachnospiraceae bacterium]|nr:hypothetical protein [Lachnospiraceae bacterium]